jgi:DNA recombination-dependent growth factor C
MGRIPFVEHLENGKMLKRLRLRLMETIPRGKRKSIADKSAEVKALKFLDELKSILDLARNVVQSTIATGR